MAKLVLRGMTPAEFSDTAGEITKGHTMNKYEHLDTGVNSSRIFGRYVRPNALEEEVNCARENTRATIYLPKPVINFLLAGGANAPLLGTILGIKLKDMADIINCTKVLEIGTDKLIASQSVNTREGMLCHGEILEKYLDDFDLESARKEEFLNLIHEEFYKTAIDAEDIGAVASEGDIELLGGYYLTLNQAAFEFMKKPVTEEAVSSFLREVLVHPSRRLVLLLQITSKVNLYHMLYNSVIVAPAGIRPEMGGNKQDPLTLMYSRIINAKDCLALVMDDMAVPLTEYCERYRELVNSIKSLTVLADTKKSKSAKSILERLKPKEGRIRGKMLSKRQDYSGRSVIIIDPTADIDTCSLPEQTLGELFRYHIAKESLRSVKTMIENESMKEDLKDLEQYKILDRVPVILNRAPTLHKLNERAFYARPWKNKAIGVNALVVEGYNADFDGDTKAVHVPLGEGAVQEVGNLMLSSQNLFVPSSGKCTLTPRQEIVYGMNVASKDYPLRAVTATFNSLEELKNEVLMHNVKVYDTVKVRGYKDDTAGRFVLRWCLVKEREGMPLMEVSKGTVSKYVDYLISYDVQTLKTGLSRMCQVGFRLALLYPPSVSVLTELQSDFLKNPFEEFHKRMEEPRRLYMNGFYDEESFNMLVSEEYEKVNEKVQATISKELGDSNGFNVLAQCGARGDKSNLIQIYAFKGKIAKSSSSSFNAIIENSFTKQLTPLEHFISAYGSRKTLIDKTQKTKDTGYATRLMSHATEGVIITNEDCGAEEGITISKAEIMKYIKSDNEKKEQARTIFVSMIRGRYEAKTNRFITNELAEQISFEREEITVRSVLTCENPCCQKCYGVDLSTRRIAVVGTPVGFIAAQAIGEPGTQLTMRTFHKGGVASKADVTSDFDRIQSFMNMTKLGSKKGSSNYDPIAWDSGTIHEKVQNKNQKEISIGLNPETRVFDINTEFKESVIKGQGMCKERGDHDPDEVLRYNDLRAAQMYLLFVMHMTYIGQADINLKHFESLVFGMTMYVLVKSNISELKIGQYYTGINLSKYNLSATEVIPRLVGVKQIPLRKASALSNINMEKIIEGLPRAVLLETEENFEDPMASAMLGLKPNLGTAYPNYMADRRAAMERPLAI